MTDKKPKEPVKEEKKEHIATAKALDRPVSTKQSREIAGFIRNKTVEQAKRLLQQVLDHKIAVPFKRFNRDTGHKKGKIAAGRYPEKAIKEFLKMINLAVANAENKGLDSKNLIIFDARANQGTQQYHYGRQRRIKMKRTHIEIGVREK